MAQQGQFKIFKSAFPMPYLYHELNRIIHERYIHTQILISGKIIVNNFLFSLWSVSWAN